MHTLARIIMTPIIVYMVLSNQPWLALALMVIAGITDMLDGAIARYFNMRTTVGAYLDPLADKIMLISLFVTLFIVGQVPLFVFLAINPPAHHATQSYIQSHNLYTNYLCRFIIIKYGNRYTCDTSTNNSVVNI